MVKRLAFIAMVILVVFMSAPVSAYDGEHDYVIDSKGRRTPIPLTYTVEEVYTYFGEEAGTLSNPQDLFIDGHDNLYIVDTGKNRVLKLNRDGEVTGIHSGEGRAALKEPHGIFVDSDGDMFIADTGNGRVVHLSPEGEFIEEFIKPDSELYDNSYPFNPVKVAIDPLGQIYIINKEDYHGFIILDPFNEFKGYVAPTRLGFSIFDRIVKIFASAEQKEKLGKRMPPTHTNFVMDSDGFIYVTTARAKTQQLKKISPVGSNIYPRQGSFGDTQGDYNLKHFGKEWIEPKFVDVCVDENGIVNILDNVTGRIYQYDSDGLMLTAFGGTGNWAGKFLNAVSLAMDSRGRIYVLDANLGTVHIFKPTSFIKTIHKALDLYYDGKYDEATGPWQEVLSIDRNYPVAHIGMGKAYLKREMWREAMAEYRAADDKDGYSAAFNGCRHELFRKYFGYVILAFLALSVLLIYIVIRLKRKAHGASFMDIKEMNCLHTALLVIFDPGNGFRSIKKDREAFSYAAPVGLLVLTIASRIVSIYLTHYPLAAVAPEDTNLWQEVSALLLPLLTWAAASYLVTTISGGESTFPEVFAAACYSMLPYILLTIPAALLSNVMSIPDSSTYNLLGTAAMGWTGLLFLISLGVMNSYNIWETIRTAMVSIFASVFMWAALGLIYILGLKFLEFIVQVYSEYKLLLFG